MKDDNVDVNLNILEILNRGNSLPGSTPISDTTDTIMLRMAEIVTEGVPDQEPPKDLFDNIERQLDAPEIEGIDTISSSSGEWRNFGKGVWRKTMATAPDGKKIFLLRCMPGSKLTTHSHGDWEYALVLEGRYQVAGRTVSAGDGQLSAANSVHPEITTEAGCLLLIVA